MIDLIKSNTNYFLENNIPNAKLEVELIISNILKCNRIDLYTKINISINKKKMNIITNYTQRRVAGEPIQYILWNAPFYGNNFFVSKDVLIPRFDTELIIDILKKYPPSKKLLDVGTGSGNLAITIEKEKLAEHIIATDISKSQLDIAKYNQNNINPNSKINFIIDDFLLSKITETFNVIISNPPYIPIEEIHQLNDLVKNNEPLNALTDGNDGYLFYKKFASYGHTILKKNGFMLLEIGINNKLEELKRIFKNYNLEIFKDLNQIPRVIKVYQP